MIFFPIFFRPIFYVNKPHQTFKIPSTYFKARRHYKQKIGYLQKILKEIDTIDCFHIYGNIFCYQLIKKIISPKTRLNIFESLKLESQIKLQSFPQWLARYIMVIFVYGFKSRIVVTPHKYLESFDINYLNCKKKIYSFDDCLEIRKSSPIREFFKYNHEYTHIFFDQPLVNYGRITPEKFSDFIEKIKEVYAKEISEKKFCVKLHPGNHSNLEFYDNLELIDPHIPSECLLINEKSTWISVSSQTLWNINNAMKISLINLIEFNSEPIRDYIRESMVSIGEEVFQPNNFKELIEKKDSHK